MDIHTNKIKLFTRIAQKYIDCFSNCTSKYFLQNSDYVVILNGATLRIMYNHGMIQVTFYPKPKDVKKDISETIILYVSDCKSGTDVNALIKKVLALTDMVVEAEQKKNHEEFIEGVNEFLNN